MDVILLPLIYVAHFLINVLFYAVTVHVILSWLFAFGIVNTYNPLVNRIADMLFRLLEPLLSPLRRFLPTISGIDLSSFALVLVLIFLDRMLAVLALKLA